MILKLQKIKVVLTVLVFTLVSFEALAQSPVKKVAMSNEIGCVVYENGEAKCYGRPLPNLLGFSLEPFPLTAKGFGDDLGELGNQWPSLVFAPGEKVEDIQFSRTSDSKFICALLNTGSVKCWGVDSEFVKAQLGVGWQELPPTLTETYPVVPLSTTEKALSMAVGAVHTCVLLDSQKVKCWGQNERGQLGLGTRSTFGLAEAEMGDALPYVDLGTDVFVQKIVAGAYHTCALLIDDRVKCWGYNQNGQLGYGDKVNRGVFTSHMGDELEFVDLGEGKVVDIHAGNNHTCAVMDTRVIRCWGHNNTSQLGIGSYTTAVGDFSNEMGARLNPTLLFENEILDGGISIGPLSEMISMHTGGDHNCAILRFGFRYQVKCWGDNGSGQLGIGTRQRVGSSAREMGKNMVESTLVFSEPIIDMMLGAETSCAQFASGDMQCWGSNKHGLLGIENNSGDAERIGDQDGEMGEELIYSVFTQTARDKNKDVTQ